jgi:beta-barrel assembly-enhancing protease
MKNIYAVFGLLILFSCNDDTSNKVSNDAKKLPNIEEDYKAFSPQLSTEQTQLLDIYSKGISKLNTENCDDWVDIVGAGVNTAQSLAIEFFGKSISENQEMSYGKDMFKKISSDFRVVDYGERLTMLQTILNRLTPFRERKKISYQIHVIDNAMVNAFSIVGGHIHITTGLLNDVQSEDELAFIVGHEIAHVDKKHCVRKIQMLESANEQFGDIGVIAANIQLFLSAPFGQTDEYEADHYGAYMTHKAGYKVEKGLDFFKRMKKNENPKLIEKLIRSHPYSEERENCLKTYIENELK